MFLAASVQVFFAPLVFLAGDWLVLLVLFACVFCAEGTENQMFCWKLGGIVEGYYGLGVMQSGLPCTVKVPLWYMV